jgi:hypothetical protein
MTKDGRLDPPAARVADVGELPEQERGFAIALGVLVLLQLAWTALLAPFVLTLVDQGILSPLGLVLALAGELCLAAGVLRMIRRGRQGTRLFLSTLVLLLLNFVAWRGSLDVTWLPRAFAMLIAVGGATVAWQRRRASARPGRTEERA